MHWFSVELKLYFPLITHLLIFRPFSHISHSSFQQIKLTVHSTHNWLHWCKCACKYFSTTLGDIQHTDHVSRVKHAFSLSIQVSNTLLHRPSPRFLVILWQMSDHDSLKCRSEAPQHKPFNFIKMSCHHSSCSSQTLRVFTIALYGGLHLSHYPSLLIHVIWSLLCGLLKVSVGIKHHNGINYPLKHYLIPF